jgi:hypothetical protein
MVVVGEATEYAIRNGRRTLMAQDVLWALRELGVWAPCRLCLQPFSMARVLAVLTLLSGCACERRVGGVHGVAGDSARQA